MILEYAALAGTILITGGVITLVVVLALAGRANDNGVYEAGELAAMRVQAGGTAPWPEPATRAACPDCHGRRCAAWRHRDTRCGDQTEPATLPAYSVGLPLPRDGRHATSVVVARWLAGDWWDNPMPVRVRRQLGQMVGTTRVPVQLGFPLRRLP